MNNTAKALIIAVSIPIALITTIAIFKPEQRPPPPPTLEQKIEKATGNARYAVKQSLNDPDSFELIEIRGPCRADGVAQRRCDAVTFDDGTDMIFFIKFRANNIFGGKVVNTVPIMTDMNGNVIETPSALRGQKAAPPESNLPGSQWTYQHDEDAMKKGVVHEASVSSSNTVSFSFPYSGEQHATLTLRTHPRHGKDLILRIEKGQFLCPSYEGCNVLVRFDDHEPATFSAVGPADNSTEVIFIRNYSRFVEKMVKAKRVRISANVYQEGAPVFEFDVSGFDPAQYKPKS